MSHNPQVHKKGGGGEAWPSSSSESVTNNTDAEEKNQRGREREKEGKCREKRPDEWSRAMRREVANETNYRRGEKEKREGGEGKRRGGGQNKNSIGRMCCDEEEINRKRGSGDETGEDVGTKDESCWGVVIHTLVSF